MKSLLKMMFGGPAKSEIQQAREELRKAADSVDRTAKKASQDQINTMAEAYAFRSARR